MRSWFTRFFIKKVINRNLAEYVCRCFWKLHDTKSIKKESEGNEKNKKGDGRNYNSSNAHEPGRLCGQDQVSQIR